MFRMEFVMTWRASCSKLILVFREALLLRQQAKRSPWKQEIMELMGEKVTAPTPDLPYNAQLHSSSFTPNFC